MKDFLKSNSENILSIIIIVAYTAIMVTVAFIFDGTGDYGDSITHYYFSRFAFSHPENFLDHWAKPFFVLLSAPFAQFGFTGIKIFNVLCASFTAFFTYKSLKLLKIKLSYLSIILLFSAPMYIILIFSGLTEILFGLVLIISIYFILKGKLNVGLIVVSFLPFVRSEGLVILLVFMVYLLWKKYWRQIFLLSVGHIVYSVVGSYYYGDILWVFTKIPYAHGTGYGSGELFHFVNWLQSIVGIGLEVLLVIGLLYMILALFKSKIRHCKELFIEELFLIYGCFVAYFIAHSLFWWLGLFNSMGLRRVILGVLPLITIIAFSGLDIITHQFVIKKQSMQIFAKVAIVIFIASIPFFVNPKIQSLKDDLSKNEEFYILDSLITDIREAAPGENEYYYSSPYLTVALDDDPFTTSPYDVLVKHYLNTKPVNAKSVIIWDFRFTLFAENIPIDTLLNDTNLQLINSYKKFDREEKISFAAFKTK